MRTIWYKNAMKLSTRQLFVRLCFKRKFRYCRITQPYFVLSRAMPYQKHSMKDNKGSTSRNILPVKSSVTVMQSALRQMIHKKDQSPWTSFVISFVRQNKINIAYNELCIHRADICTDTIRFRMKQVRELHCVDCTLYSSTSAAEGSVNTSIKTMTLENVTGIQCLSEAIPPPVSRRSILPSGMETV